MRGMRHRSGQALVEMAFAIPVLLLLLVGTIEVFRAFNAKHVITDAAREGARHAVVQDPSITKDSVRAAINMALIRSSIPPATARIVFDSNPPPTGHWRETGAVQTVSVSVGYRFAFLGPLLRATTGIDTIRIGATFAMRNE